jgi:hypothetical protein
MRWQESVIVAACVALKGVGDGAASAAVEVPTAHFAVIALSDGSVGGDVLIITGVVFAIVSLIFGLLMWKRVAFSASLLNTSTSAVMANAGAFAYGVAMCVISVIMGFPSCISPVACFHCCQ